MGRDAVARNAEVFFVTGETVYALFDFKLMLSDPVRFVAGRFFPKSRGMTKIAFAGRRVPLSAVLQTMTNTTLRH